MNPLNDPNIAAAYDAYLNAMRSGQNITPESVGLGMALSNSTDTTIRNKVVPELSKAHAEAVKKPSTARQTRSTTSAPTRAEAPTRKQASTHNPFAGTGETTDPKWKAWYKAHDEVRNMDPNLPIDNQIELYKMASAAAYKVGQTNYGKHYLEQSKSLKKTKSKANPKPPSYNTPPPPPAPEPKPQRLAQNSERDPNAVQRKLTADDYGFEGGYQAPTQDQIDARARGEVPDDLYRYGQDGNAVTDNPAYNQAPTIQMSEILVEKGLDTKTVESVFSMVSGKPEMIKNPENDLVRPGSTDDTVYHVRKQVEFYTASSSGDKLNQTTQYFNDRPPTSLFPNALTGLCRVRKADGSTEYVPD